MFKVTTKCDFKKLEKDMLNAARQKMIQNPSIMEKRLNENARRILVNYQDETGIKPEVVVKVVSAKDAVSDTQINTKISIDVLNGDEAYKNRVVEFVMSHLK